MSDKPHSFDTRVVIPDVEALPRAHPHARKVTLEGQAFATDWKLTAFVDPDKTPGGLIQVQDDLERRTRAWLDLIDRQMSPYRTDSDLTRFNEAAPWSFVALPPVIMQVVYHALDIADLSDGAFDPTLLSAVELWGFGARAVPEGLPPEVELRTLRDRKHGWRDLIWQAEGLIRPEGVRLDLCAIAKGYAVDGLSQMMRTYDGVTAALVEVGGELKGFGVRPDGLPWWVEVEAQQADDLRTVVALCDYAVATSGDLRRSFVHEGTLLSHTIDARTACPARPEIASATVIDRQAWRADALATALIVMGEDEALRFASRHNIPCLLRVRQAGALREIVSPALEAWI